MKKSRAIEVLKKQLDEIPELKKVREGDKKYQDWKTQTLAVVKSVFGEWSTNYKEANDSLFPKFFCDPFFGNDSTPTDYHARYLQGLDAKDTMLRGMITEVELREDDRAGCREDAVSVIRNICDRFHLVVRQLRERHENRSTLDVDDEYDVQDLLHALLRLHFDDVRAEECTPSYAGSASRMDFLLKSEKIVIEVKKTRKGLGAKEVGEQLMIDKEKYAAHPDLGTLICFVYDPENRIANPVGIENDLSRGSEQFKVIVLIRPK